MATTVINFGQQMDLNIGLQIGDLLFYSNNVEQIGGFDTTAQSGVILLGTIININNQVVTVEGEDGLDVPIGTMQGGGAQTDASYFFFAKDNRVNLSSITGYYGQVRFKNNSIEEAELFSASCGITQSSK